MSDIKRAVFVLKRKRLGKKPLKHINLGVCARINYAKQPRPYSHRFFVKSLFGVWSHGQSTHSSTRSSQLVWFRLLRIACEFWLKFYSTHSFPRKISLRDLSNEHHTIPWNHSFSTRLGWNLSLSLFLPLSAFATDGLWLRWRANYHYHYHFPFSGSHLALFGQQQL